MSNVKTLLVTAMFIHLFINGEGKLSNKTNAGTPDKITIKLNNGGLVFASELKETLERYLFGICPQNFKAAFNKSKNITTPSCDLDTEHQDLAARLATLALRAHGSSHADCSRLGTALANTFSALAQTAANRQALNTASNDAKKRKLSKSQKAKIQAKQRTALAVKKKAAAAAAAASAKMSA